MADDDAAYAQMLRAKHAREDDKAAAETDSPLNSQASPSSSTTASTSQSTTTRIFWAAALVAPWVVTAIIYLSRWPISRFKQTGLVITPWEAGWLSAWLLGLATVLLSAAVRRYGASPDVAPIDGSAAVDSAVRTAARGLSSGQFSLQDVQDAVGAVVEGVDANSRQQRTANVRARRSGLRGLIVGQDGRVSTSKVQAVLWTYVVLYSFIFLLLVGRHLWDRSQSPILSEYVDGFAKLLHHPLQAEYFVVLGFPISAAIAAKAIVTHKVATGDLSKSITTQQGVAAGAAEVVSDDSGNVDLLDFQYAAFNLVMIAYYFQQFFDTTIHHIGQGLPDLPPTLLALSGLSVATYLAKKSIDKGTAPQIVHADPKLVVLGQTRHIDVVGTGFCGAGGRTSFNAVRLDTVALSADAWQPTAVTAELPDDEASATALGLTVGLHQLIVTDDDGNDSTPVAIQVMKESDLPKA